MTTSIKRSLIRLVLPALASLVFLSCQKEIGDDAGNSIILPDFQTKVTASVSGFVTDENDAPVMGASVTAGGNSVSTDKYGYFEIRDALVVKSAAVVTVSQPGYFKGIKTFLAETGKSAFFRIKLIPKTIAGNINGTTGGNVTLANGLIIALPANGVVNAATNTAYTGNVNVSAHWLNPTAGDLNQTMPGDLRGIDATGAMKLLTTFGMAAVELTGASGELLQIAPGQKAILTMPLPAAVQSNAPATIPLWYFDEAKGLWMEDGQATKTGSTYVGEVSHFSFWNCDVPNNYVQFNCTVKDSDGNPVPYAFVKISVAGNPYNAGYGHTDSSGYVSGAVPNNAQLVLEIFTNYVCGTPVYTQNFSTTNANISLGVITINSSLGVATVSGTVTNCTNTAVTNGYLVTHYGNMYTRHPLSSTGAFNFNTLLCNNTATMTIIAEDLTTLQQSTPVTQTLTVGANNIGNIQACGVSIQQFITYTINGGAPIEYIFPADSIGHFGNGSTASSTIFGNRNTPAPGDNVYFTFSNTGIAVGSLQPLQNFSSTQVGTQTTLGAPINVTITEYGAVGEFMAGNFTGTIVSPGAPPTNSTIVCSFRVRRSF